ncbi:MAG: RICIN domain-containing protein [Fibrobacterales bacterium]
MKIIKNALITLVAMGSLCLGTAHALYQYNAMGEIQLGSVYTLHALENGTLYYNAEMVENQGADLLTTDGNTLTRVSNNSVWDRFYDVDNGQYVWSEEANSLYFYNGTEIIDLNPERHGMGVHADIDNGEVVWAMKDAPGYEGDTEIYLYSNGTITQITNNDYVDDVPRISNGQIVWYGGEHYESYQIFTWKDGATTQITSSGTNSYVLIEDGLIVWTGTGIGASGYDDVYTYKEGVTTNISNSEIQDLRPVLNNGTVAWMSRYHSYYEYRYAEEYHEILLWNGTSVESISGQALDYTDPQIDGDDVVFMGVNTESYARNVFHYNGSVMNQLTDNNNYRASLIVGDGQIAWKEQDGTNYITVYVATIGQLDEFGLYTIVSKLSGKALDGAGSENGANVQQWTMHGDANQQWRIQSTENGVKIINAESGKALDVADYSTENGGNVHQWDYVGGLNQQWTIGNADNGAFSITNAMSGKALDVAEWSTWDGGNIHQWDYIGGANQQWDIVQVGRVPEFLYVWADEDQNNDGAWSYSHSQAPEEYNFLTANEWGNIVMTQEEAYTGVSSLKFDLDHNSASYADAFIPTSLGGQGLEPDATNNEVGKDLSGAEFMKFSVKGVPGSEFTIALLMDTNRNSPAIELTKYLPGGINQQWQEVTIPMTEFNTINWDYSKIEKVWLRVIDSHNIQHMTFYVDNIHFVK